MIRGAYAALARPRAALERRRRVAAFDAAIAAPDLPVRLHVGAGLQALDGWLDTDVANAPLYLDAAARWPVPDACVDYVYGDNFIEHLTLDAGRRFLLEARRALRHGGRMRLVTPDVEATARAYVDGGAALDRLLSRHRRNGYRVDYAADALWIAYALSEHWQGYLYDEASLTAELHRAGFEEVVRQPLGHSDDPVLTGIDSRTEPGDEVHQMAIEASAL